MNAILILCHKNWAQTKRLMEHLKSPETDLFVHVDVKYTDWQEPEAEPGVYFLRDRRSGELFHKSLVEIELALIGLAKDVERAEGKHYRYDLTMSGQDYPLKPVSFINEQLRQTYPKPYLDAVPRDPEGKNWVYSSFRRNPTVLKAWREMKESRNPIRREFFHVYAHIVWKLANRFHFTAHDYYRRRGIEVYGGAQWWIIPDVLMDFIWEKKDEDWCERLKYAGHPDECWFHTIAMQSPMAGEILVFPTEHSAFPCRTWVSFFEEGQPFTGHPYPITMKHYEQLVSSHWWFARKFDADVDSEILDRLDEHLKRQEAI